ncbi:MULTISPECIES: hypothetical protein [Delftia]|uniref:hypothetical protein n=1 Tax=Delftia TaxID=80865 RepID=UPI000F82F3E7|nr:MULTISPECIES: hypothetical protein [Delftia]WEM00064.1 hypothetical protein PW274_07200 [Delftia tsuruhatensis]
MSDKRYTKDGEYLSKAATLELNERHGWLQYGDAQSDASNAFANNAVHAFLESAKQAQEVMAETGLTPRQLADRMKAVESAMRDAREMIEADHVDAAYQMLGEAIANLVKGAKP